jgi:DNA-binding CsgD family transcriptional regulator
VQRERTPDEIGVYGQSLLVVDVGTPKHGPGGAESFSTEAVGALLGHRLKGNQVQVAATRPGLIVVDASLNLVASNSEAIQILTFPEQVEKVRHIETLVTNKIRTQLVERQATRPPGFVDEFRSAKRTYLCRSFSVDLSGTRGNGSGTSGLLIVMLERKSNGAVTIAEIAQRFGLTARERETVQYLLQGLTSKEIAQRMKISPNTVKAFIRLVMVKMSVSTRSGIIGKIVGPKA